MHGKQESLFLFLLRCSHSLFLLCFCAGTVGVPFELPRNHPFHHHETSKKSKLKKAKLLVFKSLAKTYQVASFFGLNKPVDLACEVGATTTLLFKEGPKLAFCYAASSKVFWKTAVSGVKKDLRQADGFLFEDVS